jgi:hypothetical protein
MSTQVISARPISVPYLPYFSNCREWDSYVVFHNLVESDRCQLPPETTREGAFSDPTAPKLTPLRRYAYPPLPHYDDIQAVKFLDIALGFDKVPLAVLTRRPFPSISQLELWEDGVSSDGVVPAQDWCERRVTCSYEEVTTGGYLRGVPRYDAYAFMRCAAQVPAALVQSTGRGHVISILKTTDQLPPVHGAEARENRRE